MKNKLLKQDQDTLHYLKGYTILALAATMTIILALFFCSVALSYEAVDMNKIKMIESSNNPKAFNKSSNARGLYQITPIVLKEYNNFRKTNHSLKDLFNPTINKKIANWYMFVRIPQLLKHYGKPDTITNRLISYNAGIAYVVHKKPLPKETINYLKKYGIK